MVSMVVVVCGVLGVVMWFVWMRLVLEVDVMVVGVIVRVGSVSMVVVSKVGWMSMVDFVGCEVLYCRFLIVDDKGFVS